MSEEPKSWNGEDAGKVALKLKARYEPTIFSRTLAQIDAYCLACAVLAQKAEIDRLNALINTPITNDWFEGVRLEAAHQQERWGADHDAGKKPVDWFWLLGYLGGKCLASAIAGDMEKAKHHTISSGAALLNWWRSLSADPAARMRPGIEEPHV